MANEATALIIHAFTGDPYGCVENRAPNEIVLTAYRALDGFPAPALKEMVTVNVLAPQAAPLVVTEVQHDSFGCSHLRLARFEVTPPFKPGVYLCQVRLDVSLPGQDRAQGLALATARLDENLPFIPDTGGGGEGP